MSNFKLFNVSWLFRLNLCEIYIVFEDFVEKNYLMFYVKCFYS